jgi:uncharacterized Tic20 family protein
MSVAMPVNNGSQYSALPSGLEFSQSGRLRAIDLADGERGMAVAMHLSPLLGFVFFPLALVVPLALWLVRKDHSTFNDDHGREVMNFLISIVLLHLILAVTIIGILLWPVLWVVGIVNVIRGAVAGASGEYFRYPMTFRLL